MKGKFIVIEGIDGAGGETQSKLLFEFLENKCIPSVRLSYPDYSSPTGKFIDEYLHSKHELSADILVMLHAVDRLKDKEKINKFLEEGKVVVADRWFTSTLAYQSAQGFPLGKMLKLGEILEIPKPDIVIYLKISAETSIKRKLGEKGSLDRVEKDMDFLEKVANVYDKLSNENIFGWWVVVDGNKSREQVASEIVGIVGVGD